MTRGSGEPGGYPEGKSLESFVSGRQRMGQIWKTLFLAATAIGIIVLLALLYNVINQSFGYVAYQNEVDPQTLILDYYKQQMLDALRKVTSEDDTELVEGLRNRPTAIGFFGHSYYAENADALKLLSIDGVKPSADTVAGGQYPLVRPLYLYSSAGVLKEKPEVASFVAHYLANAGDIAVEIGYFAAPEAALAPSRAALARATGRGATDLETPPADGDIRAAGSSTVAPLTQRAAESFTAQGFGGNVEVAITGTGGGFEAFCSGQADIANASRSRNRAELLACRKAGRELVEFRVGTDGLAVVTSAENTFLQDVTREQLRAIFTTAEKWSDVDPSWPDKPILRFIPGAASGTLDFFVTGVWPTTLAETPRADKIAMLAAKISAGRLRALEAQRPLNERSDEELVQLLTDEVVKPKIAATWGLMDSLLNRAEIAEQALLIPNARLTFRSWATPSFLASPQSSKPELAGVRTAILGSLWVVLIAGLCAVPLGVGAAIYLEEYAPNNRLTQIIETNINNLAGVPSIIYGMLGLAVFVRLLEVLTSGKIFGVADSTTANGRTVLSAGLTLGLLILPLIIINAREAIRAVPQSLREAGYGLGATRWQTITAHVLPNAIPGILTGVILAISRALGETAPLVVVGASTFIVIDPNGPFSKFTTLPIQIYQWTSRPQAEFQHLAAAAILVLLVLLLAMNATAILLRNKYARSY
jgi:phosphate transport system permease protein